MAAQRRVHVIICGHLHGASIPDSDEASHVSGGFAVGKPIVAGQLIRMSAEPDRISRLVAEEVLTAIFGEDLNGCPVSLDEVAAIIQRTVDERSQQDGKLLGTYDTVVSSIHQLATPPESARTASPNDLRSLLGERLDSIRAIATKTMEMSARVNAERGGSIGPQGAGT